MKNQFGKMLAKYRRAKKLTVRKLASEINCSPSQISEIETGRRLPPKNQELLQKIASILGMNANKFMQLAQKERSEQEKVKKDSFFFNKLDPDLAWGFYREVEDADKNTLEEAVRSVISRLKRKNNGV